MLFDSKPSPKKLLDQATSMDMAETGRTVVESADAGMIQAGNGASFALEAVAQLGAISGKDLDGDDAVDSCVSGAVHFSHSARTDSDTIVTAVLTELL
jgi:hypothetical protein